MARRLNLIIPLMLCLSVTTAHAAGFAKVGVFGAVWERFEADARTEALGGADLATIRGPAAHYFNAAPLQTGVRYQSSYSHKSWPADIGFRYFSAATERFGLRVGLTVADMYLDNDIRVAYDPEGPGEDFDAGSNILVFGLSYDLARVIAPDHDGLQWILGANYRRYDIHLAESDADAYAIDLGSTVSWRRNVESGWIGAGCAVTARGLVTDDLTWGESSAPVNEHLRLGATVQGGLVSQSNPRLSAGLAVHCLSIEDFGPSAGDENTTNWALEMLFFDVFSVRMGHDNRYDNTEPRRLGWGLRTPRWLWDRGGMSVDYSTMEVFEEDLGHWTIAGWFNL